jgi:hypothetical protein
VDGLARIWSKNEVDVGNSVLIDALGTINLLAGRTSDGTMSYYDIISHGDELNASVIPISDLGSHGEIKRDHIITVGTMLTAARSFAVHGTSICWPSFTIMRRSLLTAQAKTG